MARSSTLTKQAEKARAKSLGALNLFRTAAEVLEQAASEHSNVALSAGAIASEHRTLQEEHVAQADEAKVAAVKLRELVGGAK